jgi:transposase
MSTFGNAIGIDVSKLTLDVQDHQHEKSLKVANAKTGFKELLQWIKQRNKLQDVVVCFEHTGIYSLALAEFLSQQQISFCIVAGLEIKRSLGLTRGKSDQKDAKAIARYAYLRREELKPTQLPSAQLLELKNLLSLREKMVRNRKGYQNSLKELKETLKVSKSNLLYQAQQKLIEELTAQIKRIEHKIKQVMAQDEQLNKLFKLVTSVKGVGLILGTSFLVYTNGFTAFANWRKFACYAGIAPFEYQSGTSIKAPKRVSHLAQKHLKGLLSNAACVCIQSSKEFKTYYHRRLQEGKSKLAVQNILRNKIVARVFAVVKRGTPFEEDYQQAA